MRNSLPGGVAKARSGRYRDALEVGGLPASAPPVKEVRQGPRQLPGAGVEPGLAARASGGEQDVVLGFEPGQRLLVVVKLLGRDAGPAAGQE